MALTEFIKSNNAWNMPLKDLNFPFSKFHSFEYYEKNDPKTSRIITWTLAEENKAEGWYLYDYYHYITQVSTTLLPSTYLERYWQLRPTARLEWFQAELRHVEDLMNIIRDVGYIKDRPVYTVAKFFHYEPIGWYIVLDGGHHRLQAVRELQYRKELNLNFKIPTLISWDRESEKRCLK